MSKKITKELSDQAHAEYFNGFVRVGTFGKSVALKPHEAIRLAEWIIDNEETISE